MHSRALLCIVAVLLLASPVFASGLVRRLLSQDASIVITSATGSADQTSVSVAFVASRRGDIPLNNAKYYTLTAYELGSTTIAASVVGTVSPLVLGGLDGSHKQYNLVVTYSQSSILPPSAGWVWPDVPPPPPPHTGVHIYSLKYITGGPDFGQLFSIFVLPDSASFNALSSIQVVVTDTTTGNTVYAGGSTNIAPLISALASNGIATYSSLGFVPSFPIYSAFVDGDHYTLQVTSTFNDQAATAVLVTSGVWSSTLGVINFFV